MDLSLRVTYERQRALLRGARKYLENGWTRGAFARDAAGAPVRSWSEYATCVCLIGALNRAYQERDWGDSIGLLDSVFRRLHTANLGPSDELPLAATLLAGWNDGEGRTKEEVIALVDRAIAELDTYLTSTTEPAC